MTYKYKILAFDPKQGTIVVEFEGYEACAFNAPFINGSYLTGQALEDYIQILYPQVLAYESRVVLVETISGDEILAQLVEPPIPHVETPVIIPEAAALVVSIEPVKSTYYIGEQPEAVITFDKPIGPTTFINIVLNINSESISYMPNQYETIMPSPIKPFKIPGTNGQTLEMYLGDTTARYKGRAYPGGLSYNQGTISAKTMLNQRDNQPYVVSAPIQLISEPVPNT